MTNFDYKGLVSSKGRYRVLQCLLVTGALVSTGPRLREGLDLQNMAPAHWASTRYYAAGHDVWLAETGKLSCVHRKKFTRRPLLAATAGLSHEACNRTVEQTRISRAVRRA